MRKLYFLFYDVAIMAIAPFIALLIRNDYPLWDKAVNLVPYAVMSAVISAFLFWGFRTNKILWRHIALPDFIRISAAITATILLAMTFSFILFRLDGVARSIPFLQWATAVCVIIGSRVFMRAYFPIHKEKKDHINVIPTERKHVLVVGLNPVTELYLRCVSDLGKGDIIIEGLLNEKKKTKGQLLYGHKVIGSPVDLPDILAQYEVHGIDITDIVITMPFNELSEPSQAQLLHWERSADVILNLFEERLGFGHTQKQTEQKTAEQKTTGQKTAGQHSKTITSHSAKTPLNYNFETEKFCYNGYLPVKRGFDVIGSLVLMVICAPLILMAALLVAIDLKLPLIFWQQRPGLFGQPFRIYKFRTMAAAHDSHGSRIPDNERLSKIGKFLRKSRLDELPQLYHVFNGEMSFVGPRPLLPVDIPENGKSRLNMRPGITGWAQINGGHSVPANEKMALDIWYLNHVSFWLDIKIMIQTIHVAIFGEKINRNAIKVAELEFKKVMALPDKKQVIKKQVA